MQSQVRFNRVPEKVSVKFWRLAQQASIEKVPRRSGKLWCRARSGSTGLRRRSGEGRRLSRSGSTGFRNR